MRDLLNLIRWLLLGLVRSRRSLEAENLALRHQLTVLHRSAPKRPTLRNFDRLVFVCLYRIAPRILDALTIVEPETVIRWHRAGFRSFWRWKSRRRAGRPSVTPEIRRLIREMSLANPLWGAPRIHGELLKLGIDIASNPQMKTPSSHFGGLPLPASWQMLNVKCSLAEQRSKTELTDSRRPQSYRIATRARPGMAKRGPRGSGGCTPRPAIHPPRDKFGRR